MSKNNIYILVIVLVLVGLFVWGRILRENNIVYTEESSEIACLPNGHQQVAEHIHSELSITVDGVAEVVPANIGVTTVCMSEIHTHDDSGAIHVESVYAGRIKDFHLGHFFSVWKKSPERSGYDLEILQDGQVKNSVKEVQIKDHSVIELKYTKQA